jgi:hypothetical protein
MEEILRNRNTEILLNNHEGFQKLSTIHTQIFKVKYTQAYLKRRMTSYNMYKTIYHFFGVASVASV